MAQISKESMVKLLAQKASGINDESKKVLKDYKKGNINVQQFIESYKDQKIEYCKTLYCKEALTKVNNI